MYWRMHLRRIIYVLILLLVIYLTIFRRRSPRVFLTVSQLNEVFEKQTPENLSRQRIPRIIHQTWKTARVPPHWNRTVESVRQCNVGKFEYHHWTDDEMHDFVQREEPDFYEHTFLKYPFDIQRVDAFRYIVLHRQGGIYIDMDNGCLQSFDSLLIALEALDPHATHLAAFPRTTPIGISNGFMISTAGHPLFQILIARLSMFNHYYLIDYLTVMLTAGPSYLSINEFFFDTSSERAVVRILDEIVYSSIYTWHTPGNSWHRRDARVILFFYHSFRKHSRTILSCSLLAMSVIGVCVLYRRRKRYNSIVAHCARKINIRR